MTKLGSYLPSVDGVHPFVRFLDDNRTIPMSVLSERAGVSHNSINRWRLEGREPKLSDIEAVLNALGYDIVMVKRESACD